MWYIDTSALMKLCVREAESESLREFIAGEELVVSRLALTELPRAVRRRSEDAAIAGDVLGTIDLSPLAHDTLTAAAALPPDTLRSLDAIHLATALALGDACAGVITYDRRMQDAARGLGLEVRAPGRP